MKILNRYILKEHLGPFLGALGIIMFVFVLKFISQYVGRIFGKGLDLSVIGELLYLNLAWMLALAAPMAVLVSTLMAFGRMSSDNEIIAIRSSGISFTKILRILLLAGLVLTAGMYYFNDKVLPEYNLRAKKLFHDISRKKPTLELTEGVFTDFKNFSILTNHVIRAQKDEPGSMITGPDAPPSGVDKMEDIVIIDRSNIHYQRTITAEYGYLYYDEAKTRLVFTLYNGEMHEVDKETYKEYRRMHFKKNIFYVFTEEFLLDRSGQTSRGDREMTVAMLQEQVRKRRDEIKREEKSIHNNWRRFLMNFKTEMALLQSKWPQLEKEGDSLQVVLNRSRIISSRERLKRKVYQAYSPIRNSFRVIKNAKRSISKYQVEIYKKSAISFAIIVFILLGAPLGIKTRKGSMGVSFVMSLGFFVLYWTFLIGGEELADRNILHPFTAMWAANFLLGGTGLLLSWRTLRETHPIPWDALVTKLRQLIHAKA